MGRLLKLLIITVLLAAVCEAHGDKWRKQHGGRQSDKYDSEESTGDDGSEGWDDKDEDARDVQPVRLVNCPRSSRLTARPVCLERSSIDRCIVKENYCFIDDVCYKDGDGNTRDLFQFCRAKSTFTEWHEEYADLDKEGVVIEMKKQDYHTLEMNMKEACSVIAASARTFCSENPERCNTFLCDLVGANDQSVSESIPLELDRCWMEKEDDDDEWRLFAKMSQSRADFGQICYGQTNGNDHDIHWLLPSCIMKKAVKGARETLEKTFLIEINHIESECYHGDIGWLYAVISGTVLLLIFVVSLTAVIVCCIKKNRRTRRPTTAAVTMPTEPSLGSKSPTTMMEPPTYMEATAPPPAYQAPGVDNPVYGVAEEKKQPVA